MIITSVNHIHFQFPPHSKEAIRFFYSTVLGAHELHSLPKKQWLQFEMGEQRLCFTPISGTAKRTPAQHVAFNVRGIRDLKQRLHAFDLDFIESNPNKPAQQVYVKDPAGNQLEFLEISRQTSTSAP